MTTIRTSVCPGAVKKIGKWCGAAGLTVALNAYDPSAADIYDFLSERPPLIIDLNRSMCDSAAYLLIS
jgi:hypothetical protein